MEASGRFPDKEGRVAFGREVCGETASVAAKE